MDACKSAVALDTENGNIKDSRGVARALTGDIEGAIKDFKAFIEWTSERQGWKKKQAQRQGWIDELRADRNPFTEELLKSLLDS